MKLRIALLQLLPGATLEDQLRIGVEACREAKGRGADLALFPEMWSCGYTIPEDPEALRSASACRCSWPKAVRTPRRTSIPPSSTSPPSGSNQASFAGGVGADSATVGYGLNRADWSYIPGGAVSGTALIRPDFPELLTFPYLWQQVEYVLGGGSSHYMFLVLAARDLVGE